MKTKKTLAILVLTLGLATKIAKADFTFGEPSYLSEPVSSVSWEYSVCISPNGLELYFSSFGPYGFHDLYVVDRPSPGDPWGNKTNLGPHINSHVPDFSPSISGDGLSLFFSRGTSGQNNATIWVTTRATLSDPWGPPTKLKPIINKGPINGTPAISSDGLSLYFARWEAGNGDIFVSTRLTTADQWSEAVRLPLHINTEFDEAAPYVTPDGLCLLFCSATRDYSDDEPRPDGVGEADIWIARRRGTSDEWGEPVPLPIPINTTFDEVDACISWDGSTLYFCSDRGADFEGYGVYQAPILPVVDFNGDGIVDSDDMCIMIDHWGTDEPLCDVGPMPWGDGIVDVRDLIILAEHLFEDNRLVAHWALDEEVGNTAYDSTGKYDANLHGGPIWQPTSGKNDGALQFDGVDDYVSTPFILNPSKGSLSVFAWVKGGAPGQVIISQSDTVVDNTTQFGSAWLWADSSYGRLITRLMHPPFDPLMSETVITDGQWHNVGLVYNFIELRRYLYVDKAEVARDTDIVGGVGSDGGLYIGAGESFVPVSF
jgi:hypothetical protein